jgi:hypothetical protein
MDSLAVVMALLYREVKVINFTIGWDVLKLLTTFYSTNVNNYNQSAGNSNSRCQLRRPHPHPAFLFLLPSSPLAVYCSAFSCIFLHPLAQAQRSWGIKATQAAKGKIKSVALEQAEAGAGADKVKRGSPETIRESSFELFRCSFEQYYSKPFKHNDD